MDIEVFNFIGVTIARATDKYISGGLNGMIDTIRPFIYVCLTVYISLKGYAQIFGKTDDLLRDVVIQCLIVTCITSISLNAVNITTYVQGSIEAFASGLSSAISTVNGADSNDVNVFKLLDKLSTSGIEQVAYCFDQFKVTRGNTYGWFIAMLVVGASTASITLTAAVIIIGSKFLLTVLLLISPLFISLACFPATRRFFDSWAGKVVENTLVQIICVSVITMSVSIVDSYLKMNGLTSAAEDGLYPLSIAFQLLVVFGVLTFVIKQIPNISGSLAGGFASAAMTLKDVMQPAQTAAGLAKTGVAAAAGFMAGRGQAPADASDVGSRQPWAQQQGNNITSGNGEQYRSSDEAKKQQLVKDMIAERTRQNTEQR